MPLSQVNKKKMMILLLPIRADLSQTKHEVNTLYEDRMRYL